MGQEPRPFGCQQKPHDPTVTESIKSRTFNPELFDKLDHIGCHVHIVKLLCARASPMSSGIRQIKRKIFGQRFYDLPENSVVFPIAVQQDQRPSAAVPFIIHFDAV